MKNFLSICCLSLLFVGCSNSLEEYTSAPEESTVLSRAASESLAVTKKIEISPAYQGTSLLVLSDYAEQIKKQLDTTTEDLITDVNDGIIEVNPLNVSEESLPAPILDCEKKALVVAIPQNLRVGSHLQTGLAFHKKGETEGLQFFFDISVIEFNEDNATAMNFPTSRSNNNDSLPNVLLSCLRMCESLNGISVLITSPNYARIGSSSIQGGSNALVKPLFITEDDKFYVEANVQHHSCRQAKVLRVTNNYTYAEEVPFANTVYYRGYIPLAHPVDGTEHIAFITK